MIVLGTHSARRIEIFSFFSIPFQQATPHFDEETFTQNLSPAHFVEMLAQNKALSLQSRFPNTPILSADTIVYKGGKIYGKPRSKGEATNYLTELSGTTHTVYTGLAIHTNQTTYVAHETTDVTFHPLKPKQIDAYLQAISYEDKAGAYAIQHTGGIIVHSIKGCYYNVMGLPLTTLQTLLLKATGIDLWNSLN